jgi:hypothetical protein
VSALENIPEYHSATHFPEEKKEVERLGSLYEMQISRPKKRDRLPQRLNRIQETSPKISPVELNVCQQRPAVLGSPGYG